MCLCEHVSLHGGEVQDIYFWRLPYPRVGCVFESVCSSVYVLVRFLCMRVRARAHKTSRGVNLFK